MAELVAEGRRAYRSGNYATAAGHFSAALELDPQSELAADYLELAEDRSRQARQRRCAQRVERERRVEPVEGYLVMNRAIREFRGEKL